MNNNAITTNGNNLNICIGKKVALITISVFIALTMFCIGFACNAAWKHHADTKQEEMLVLQQEAEKKQLAQEEEAYEENLLAWKYATVSSNIERDTAADAYGVEIAAKRAIAGDYQQAKMCNQLNDPDVILQLYSDFSAAADTKVAEYMDTYQIATDRASKKADDIRIKYLDHINTNMADSFEKIYKKDKTSASLERNWQNYNASVLETAVKQIKSKALKDMQEGNLLN